MAYECYITKSKLSSFDISILGILLVIGCSMILIYGNEVYFATKSDN